MVALGTLLVGLAFATLVVAKSIPALAVMVLIWTLGEIIRPRSRARSSPIVRPNTPAVGTRRRWA